jgi:drug/metabolite transporter (DMT)-like permease
MTKSGRASGQATVGGLAAGTGAGLLWGLAFLVPVLLAGWGAVAVIFGRYLACGLISSAVLMAGGSRVRRLARDHWRPGLVFALTGNVGYYLLLVIGIDSVGAPVTDIVIGCIPVTVAVSANLGSRIYRWRRLMVPVTLVAAGLLTVNTLELTGSSAVHQASAVTRVLGVIAACGAMLTWTWYGLANARFLHAHEEVAPATWSIIVGAATGVITLPLLPIGIWTHQLTRGGSGNASVQALLAGSVILGVVVSFGGTWLWNAASVRLPGTMAGMLINVETLSGFCYVYAARAQWPPLGQVAGFALIIVGVILVVRLRDDGHGRAARDDQPSDGPAPEGAGPPPEPRMAAASIDGSSGAGMKAEFHTPT